jgi:ComF family protein
MKCIDFILKIVFPPRCLACDISIIEGVLCQTCFDGIPRYTTLFCARCGARLPGKNSGAKKICHRNTDYLLGSAGPYDDPTLKLLIHHLKFRSVKGAAKPLANLLALYLGNIEIDPGEFILIPLPLSRKRLNQRGFNQAEEIARCLAEHTPRKVRNDILVRSKNTKPQTETTSATERRQNILGCFSVIKPEEVRHKDVIVLDDVTTSGATLGEAARVLKAAGARKIIGLTAARA